MAYYEVCSIAHGLEKPLENAPLGPPPETAKLGIPVAKTRRKVIGVGPIAMGEMVG